MRQINRIIIHAADTPADMDIGADTIRRWHVKERGWSDIGYHFVIRRSGLVETGRLIEEQGAHVRGENEDSIGICLVGGRPDCNFTFAQYVAMLDLIGDLAHRYNIPLVAVSGHRDWDSGKTCPTFDVASLLSHLQPGDIS